MIAMTSSPPTYISHAKGIKMAERINPSAM
jgi:hypothetical protein